MHSALDVSGKDLQKARQSAKRKRASAACTRCKGSKTKCSEYRPCSKCKKSGLTDTCTDGDSIYRIPAANCPEIQAEISPSNSQPFRGDETLYFEKQDNSRKITENGGASWNTTNHLTATCLSSEITTSLHHIPGAKAATVVAINGPVGASASNLKFHCAARIPSMLDSRVPATHANLRYIMQDQASDRTLHRRHQSDLLSAQIIRPAPHPMLQAQILLRSILQAQQPNFPSPSNQLTSASLPHAVSALLSPAAGPFPSPQPDSDTLRLILALRVAAAAAPLARPPPPRF